MCLGDSREDGHGLQGCAVGPCLEFSASANTGDSGLAEPRVLEKDRHGPDAEADGIAESLGDMLLLDDVIKRLGTPLRANLGPSIRLGATLTGETNDCVPSFDPAR